MFPDARIRRRTAIRPLLLGLGLALAALASAGEVRAEPPVTSAQDAYCRGEARSRVFSTPDPQNVGLHEVGRRIYQGCMRGLSSGKGRGGHRHHRRRYRR